MSVVKSAPKRPGVGHRRKVSKRREKYAPHHGALGDSMRPAVPGILGRHWCLGRQTMRVPWSMTSCRVWLVVDGSRAGQADTP